jgi:hypothetical protein
LITDETTATRLLQEKKLGVSIVNGASVVA